MSTDNPGIDYGMGTTNIDPTTGIRFGVISQNAVLQSWCDSAEPDYGAPHCPKCGNEATDPESRWEDCSTIPPDEDVNRDDYEIAPHSCGDYACDDCKYLFDGDEAFGDEPNGYTLQDGEYTASAGTDGDIFILQSPYYTHAQFCSPCAPGAGYLENPCPDGPKTYCFGLDWFDASIEPCPYPIYRVDTGECIYTPPAE